MTISKAVSVSKPVQQLINEGYSQQTIEGALAARITEAASMLHIGGNLASGESIKIAVMLISEYPTNSLEDFTLMLQRGIIGRYGKVFGFDISVVFGWMGMYLEEWAEEKERQLAKEKNKLSESIQPQPGQWSPETEAMIKSFQGWLASTDQKYHVPQLTKQEIRKEGKSTPPQRKSMAYIPNPELVIQHQKKMQWINECTEPDGGDGWKMKEGALSFEEWMKTDKQP